jgi:hypothetical protein
MKNQKISCKKFQKSLAIFVMVMNFTSIAKAEENLQEQEFHSIEVENSVIQNEKDFGYVITALPPEEKKLSNNTLYNLKNEYYEGIKVILEAGLNSSEKPDQKEFYLNAYQLIKDISVSSNAKIKIKVFNLYDQYLGFIQYEKKDPTIKISPFLLIPAELDQQNKKIVSSMNEVQKAVDKAVLKDEIKDGVGFIIPKTNSVPANTITTETKNNSGKPEPIIRAPMTDNSNILVETKIDQAVVDTKPKKIKIANISDSEIHVIIKKPNGEVYGDSWTVANDIYVPQFLNLQSEPITIDSESTIIITNTKTSKTLIKKANELNIDERGNYVLTVDNFSSESKSQELNNVLR